MKRLSVAAAFVALLFTTITVATVEATADNVLRRRSNNLLNPLGEYRSWHNARRARLLKSRFAPTTIAVSEPSELPETPPEQEAVETSRITSFFEPQSPETLFPVRQQQPQPQPQPQIQPQIQSQQENGQQQQQQIITEINFQKNKADSNNDADDNNRKVPYIISYKAQKHTGPALITYGNAQPYNPESSENVRQQAEFFHDDSNIEKSDVYKKPTQESTTFEVQVEPAASANTIPNTVSDEKSLEKYEQAPYGMQSAESKEAEYKEEKLQPSPTPYERIDFQQPPPQPPNRVIFYGNGNPNWISSSSIISRIMEKQPRKLEKRANNQRSSLHVWPWAEPGTIPFEPIGGGGGIGLPQERMLNNEATTTQNGGAGGAYRFNSVYNAPFFTAAENVEKQNPYKDYYGSKRLIHLSPLPQPPKSLPYSPYIKPKRILVQ